MHKVYVNLLKSEKYISVWELEAGALYRIISRNSLHGIWMPTNSGFLISREKYNNIYPFVEYHRATDRVNGTAKPFEYIEQSPFDEYDLIDILESKDIVRQGNVNYYGPMKFHSYMNSIETDEDALQELEKYQ